jgi:hypothetical protein
MERRGQVAVTVVRDVSAKTLLQEAFGAILQGTDQASRRVPPSVPPYVDEMQFRYNHRHEDLFTLFLDALVKPVPDV